MPRSLSRTLSTTGSLKFLAGGILATVAFGQPDLSSNGANEVKPASINAAFKIVIDYSKAPYPLYVSDAGNNRVLVWKDSAHFKTGAPADLAIGQPDLTTALANIDSATGLPTNTSLSIREALRWIVTAICTWPMRETTACCGFRVPWIKAAGSPRIPFMASRILFRTFLLRLTLPA